MLALDTPPAPRPRPVAAAARRAYGTLSTLLVVARSRLRWGRTRLGALTRTGGGGLRTAGREAGMATAEYAIATLAAVGFAGLLLVILKSAEVRGLLLGIIKSALSVG
ncbi:DUF4244 domain-containing protein [Luteimicrobium sp. NPDC057192]|uniref:DUF4244 domain-containing protein n=1 Tax=Luteimicrobium sp. NPDC057192 TaxID=3346042 RepID=UPI0036288111